VNTTHRDLSSARAGWRYRRVEELAPEQLAPGFRRRASRLRAKGAGAQTSRLARLDAPDCTRARSDPQRRRRPCSRFEKETLIEMPVLA